MNIFDIFLSIGLFNLLMMAYSDYKIGKIDSRQNFFMFGLVSTIVFVTDSIFVYLVCIFGLILFFALTQKLFNVGDKNAFFWIVPGFVLFGLQYFVLFLIPIILGMVFSKILLKKGEKVPFFPVIFVSFFFVALVKYFIFK